MGFNLKKSFINYLTVELLGFYIDMLDIYSIEDKI